MLPSASICCTPVIAWSSTQLHTMTMDFPFEQSPAGPPRLPPQDPLPSAVGQGGVPLLPTFITKSREGGVSNNTAFTR